MELEKLMSAMMHDLLEARKRADSYSKHISSEYRQDGPLAGYTIPKLNINNIRFDLKFALDSQQEDVQPSTEKDNTSPPPPNANIKTLDFKTRESITSRAANSLETNILGDNNVRMAINKDKNITLLGKKINKHFIDHVTVDERGEVNADIDKITDMVIKDSNLSKAESNKLFETIKKSVTSTVDNVKLTSQAKKEHTPSIIIEANKLKELPEHMISSLSFDIDVVDKGWTDIEEYDLYKQKLSDV